MSSPNFTLGVAFTAASHKSKVVYKPMAKTQIITNITNMTSKHGHAQIFLLPEQDLQVSWATPSVDNPHVS